MNYEYAKSGTESTGKVKSYFTTRHVCQKVSISTRLDQLLIEDRFFRELKAAVTGMEDSINGYEYLVNVLNENGWYVPREYILGGTIYSIKIEEVSDFKEAETKSQTFSAEFNAAFNGLGAGVGYSNKKSNEISSSHTEKRNELTFLQTGGTLFGKDNLNQWNDSLDRPENWKIISYTSLYPSLILLHDKDDELLQHCLHLLRKFNDYASVKDMQKFIDVGDYQKKIVQQLDSY